VRYVSVERESIDPVSADDGVDKAGSPLVITVASATAATTAAAAAAAVATTATAAAACAATVTATAATATTTTAAVATTATAAAGSRRARLSLIDNEGTTFEILAVQSIDRCVPCVLVGHRHEAEATRTTGLSIGTDEDLDNFTMSGEEVSE